MHRVVRETVDLSVGRSADLKAVQAQLIAALSAEGPGAAALSAALDRAAAERSLRIDRLELDLGEIAGADWLAVFVERLAEAAEAAVTRPEAPGALPAEAVANGVRGIARGVQERAAAQQVEEAVLHFLANGRPPWWQRDGMARGWVADAVEGLSAQGRARIARQAAADRQTLLRIAVHLPEDALARLAVPGSLADLLPHAPAWRAWIGNVAALSSPPSWRWRAAFWRPFLAAAGRGAGTDMDSSVAARHWAEALADIAPGALNALIATLTRPPANCPLPPPWRAALARALMAEVRSKTSATGPDAKRPDAGGKPETPTGTPSEEPHPNEQGRAKATHDRAVGPDGIGPMSTERTAGTGKRAGSVPRETRGAMAAASAGWPDETAEAIPAAGAGMVILHPFLPEFYARLGLVKEGSFVDPDAAQRAVHLLGRLAFGHSDASEADLTLAKLMSGLKSEAALLPLELTKEDCEAADGLLMAVVGHWTALRTSSPDWLRAQFLDRPGSLLPAEHGWILNVEGRAQDVLLSRLPWGIGAVAVPWAPWLLTVAWGD